MMLIVLVAVASCSFGFVSVVASVSASTFGPYKEDGSDGAAVGTKYAVAVERSLRSGDAVLKAVAATSSKSVGASKTTEAESSPTGANDDLAIHTVVTVNGSPYVNFQTRIMYGTYLRMQKMPGSENFRYFTRILSRQSNDALMTEIPTVRVEPLNPECDRWCEFPVADRPHSIAEWLKTEDSKKAKWILIIESDYVWVRQTTIAHAIRDECFFNPRPNHPGER